MVHTCGEPNEIELTTAHELFHRSLQELLPSLLSTRAIAVRKRERQDKKRAC